MVEVEVEVNYHERVPIPEERRPELDRDKKILGTRAIFRTRTLEKMSVGEDVIRVEREVDIGGYDSTEGFYYRVEEYAINRDGKRKEISRNGYTSDALRSLKLSGL